MYLALIKNDIVKVEWQDIGEGWSGDYNPDDPNDVELLRFYVVKNDPESPDFPNAWEDVEDASYCTRMPVNTPDEVLIRALAVIMQEVYDAVEAGISIKKACEQLSWLCPDDFVVKG